MFLKLFVLAVVSLMSQVHSANVLVMLPLPYRSHTDNYRPILNALAAKGHNVTVVSPFPNKPSVPNLTDIVVPSVRGDVLGTLPKLLEMASFWYKLTGLWDLGINTMPTAFGLEQVQRFINDKDSKFDLVIVETWFFQEAFVAFGHKYNAPVINLSPIYLFPEAAYHTGNYMPVTYVPTMHYSFSDQMSFLERVVNSFFYFWEIFYSELYYLDFQENMMRKHFKYKSNPENLPPLRSMLRNTSLTLIDFHFAVGYPTPLHKNVVPFGATNIKRAEKLPADLQKLLDEAKDGVIYFSLGTFFNVGELKPFMVDAIISAFGKVKQKVLFKVEDPSQLKQYDTKNIEIRPWFPQSSILAHRNCKLFVTHGGLHGLLEAIYHRVPMVAVPLLGDQRYNTKFIEHVGIGEVLEINTITESKLLEAINHVLGEPRYKENIEIRSALIKDNPYDIMDNAIYWIEYVIRHKGAPHLRPAVLDLYWYQYLMLDVIAFYLLVVSVVVYAICKIVKLFMNCIAWLCCSKKSKTSSKKSKRE